MGNYWSVSLRDFLNASGNLAQLSPRGIRLARYFAEIVSQATLYDEPTTLRCRRRPQRRPCATPLTIFFDVDNEDVLWFCPTCNDEGGIGGWQGTFWDHGELTELLS